MELKTLRYFLTVADECSITKAASRLYISQPALTRQIHALEDECGAMLFIRGRQGLILTDEGLLLQSRARELLDFAAKTLSDIKGERSEILGRLAVGMGEIRSCALLCKALSAFAALHPKVDIEVRTANADAIKLDIERGTLDLGLLLEPVELDLFETFPYGVEEHFELLMKEDDPLAAKQVIRPADLKGRRCFLPTRPQVRKELERQLRDSSIFEHALSSNFSSNAALLTACGLGPALIVADGYSYLGVPGLTIRPLDPPLTTSATIAYKKSAIHSRACRAFLQFLRGPHSNLSDVELG